MFSVSTDKHLPSQKKGKIMAINKHRPVIADRKNVDVFDRDALAHGGYLYTNSDRLSCRLATQRSTDAILAADCFRGRSVIDLGCGDGFYSFRWWDLGHPK